MARDYATGYAFVIAEGDPTKPKIEQAGFSVLYRDDSAYGAFFPLLSMISSAGGDSSAGEANTFETRARSSISLYYEWSHQVFDWLPLAALVGPPTVSQAN